MALSHEQREYLVDGITEALTEGALENMAKSNAEINRKKIELNKAKVDRIKANPINKYTPGAYARRRKLRWKSGVAGVKAKGWDWAAKKLEGKKKD